MIENPWSSRLFDWIPLSKLLEKDNVRNMKMDMCTFGTPYRKPTRLVCGGLAWAPRELTCSCSVGHDILCGKARVIRDGCVRSFWKTRMAAEFLYEVCRFFARLLANSSPNEAWRRRGEPVLAPTWEDRMRKWGRFC